MYKFALAPSRRTWSRSARWSEKMESSPHFTLQQIISLSRAVEVRATKKPGEGFEGYLTTRFCTWSLRIEEVLFHEPHPTYIQCWLRGIECFRKRLQATVAQVTRCVTYYILVVLRKLAMDFGPHSAQHRVPVIRYNSCTACTTSVSRQSGNRYYCASPGVCPEQV